MKHIAMMVLAAALAVTAAHGAAAYGSPLHITVSSFGNGTLNDDLNGKLDAALAAAGGIRVHGANHTVSMEVHPGYGYESYAERYAGIYVDDVEAAVSAVESLGWWADAEPAPLLVLGHRAGFNGDALVVALSVLNLADVPLEVGTTLRVGNMEFSPSGIGETVQPGEPPRTLLLTVATQNLANPVGSTAWYSAWWNANGDTGRLQFSSIIE